MNYKYIVLLFISQLVRSQINVDSTSTEHKQHVKQEEKLRRKADSLAEADKLETSIYGTKSTTYNFNGYDYDSYADGKYSDVAKAENWSKWSLPENMDERLRIYKRRKNFKIYIVISIIVILIVLFFSLKKKYSNKTFK